MRHTRLRSSETVFGRMWMAHGPCVRSTIVCIRGNLLSCLQYNHAWFCATLTGLWRPPTRE